MEVSTIPHLFFWPKIWYIYHSPHFFGDPEVPFISSAPEFRSFRAKGPQGAKELMTPVIQITSLRHRYTILLGGYDYMILYIWVNYNDLTTTSLEIMVSKGNHPQMALIQVSELL